jgi:hypothetical protein
MIGENLIMDLTPEDKQRIEEEERKRVSEEQYRAEFRSKLQGEPGAPIKKPNRIGWILGIVAVLIAATLIWSNSSRLKPSDNVAAPAADAASKPTPVPKTRKVPVNLKIATGQIIVTKNGYVQYRITITPEMVEPVVTGSFNASGGTGNDITAVIADETNYTNWINGHQARVFWGTPGKQTTGNFEVRLAPGMYYLVFSNKFSAFTDKQVFLDVDLNYYKVVPNNDLELSIPPMRTN